MKKGIGSLAGVILLAMILATGNVRATEQNAKASSHENIEATLELENWMVDPVVWNSIPSDGMDSCDKGQKADAGMSDHQNWELASESMELEDWMTNDSLWDVQRYSNIEQEQELILENWMVKKEIWEI